MVWGTLDHQFPYVVTARTNTLVLYFNSKQQMPWKYPDISAALWSASLSFTFTPVPLMLYGIIAIHMLLLLLKDAPPGICRVHVIDVYPSVEVPQKNHTLSLLKLNPFLHFLNRFKENIDRLKCKSQVKS